MCVCVYIVGLLIYFFWYVCVSMRLCLQVHTCHGSVYGHQRASFGYWFFPATFWDTGTEVRLSGLCTTSQPTEKEKAQIHMLSKCMVSGITSVGISAIASDAIQQHSYFCDSGKYPFQKDLPNSCKEVRPHMEVKT